MYGLLLPEIPQIYGMAPNYRKDRPVRHVKSCSADDHIHLVFSAIHGLDSGWGDAFDLICDHSDVLFREALEIAMSGGETATSQARSLGGPEDTYRRQPTGN